MRQAGPLRKHAVHAREQAGSPCRRSVKIILMPEFPAWSRGRLLRFAGPLDRGQATYFAISPIPTTGARSRASRPARVQLAHAARALDPRGNARSLSRGAHSNTHPSVLRAVLRSGVFAEGWGGVHREHDGRCRLPGRRPAVPPEPAQVLPARRRECAARPGRARRRLDAEQAMD
jgi:hypothetical protein